MRALTTKQKKLLDKFFKSRTQTSHEEFMSGSVFKGGDHNIGIDELFKYDDELFVKIEQINDTEILHQNIERYLNDKSSDWINNREQDRV
jgi:hypothetical protein